MAVAIQARLADVVEWLTRDLPQAQEFTVWLLARPRCRILSVESQ